MSEKKAPLPYDNDTDRLLFDDIFEVASATECTGLIPASPESAPQAASYSDIYDIPLAAGAKKANHRIQTVNKADDAKTK